jgi:hypothetical protein
MELKSNICTIDMFAGLSLMPTKSAMCVATVWFGTAVGGISRICARAAKSLAHRDLRRRGYFTKEFGQGRPAHIHQIHELCLIETTWG